MKVLSLFDGISCARVALDKLGIPVDIYFASEIDKYAIEIALKNYYQTVQLGDVRRVDKEVVGDIDLLIGGSPCQDLSIAKNNRKGLSGERSGLFWEYVRILQDVKPKYFILENVASMPNEAKQIITKVLGVQPIMINAGLVSAQNRKRLFWTNIPGVTLPADKGIYLKDVLEFDTPIEVILNNKGVEVNKAYTIDANYFKGGKIGGTHQSSQRNYAIRLGIVGDNKAQSGRVYSTEGKSVALQANGGGMGAKTGLYVVNEYVRKLTPIECERLQCLPDNYTAGISNTQRYKCLGNAFNVDVIAHILSFVLQTT